MNTDGIGFRPFKVFGSWQQPAWSPTGQLAAVRLVRGESEVFVIDPLTGSARQLTRDGASSPSWSPDGRRLAAVHRGWIELIGSRGGRLRRLTRGGGPTWAPNGKELAFVGAHNRLFVISARGGRPRPVGHIFAQWVDWQPVTGKRPRRCQAPSGSSVVAASPDATVTIDPSAVGEYGAPAFSVLGCLRSDGRQRVVESMPPSYPVGAFGLVLGVGAVEVASDYAALVNESSYPHGPFSDAMVAVFDLRSGAAVADRGGESASGLGAGIDQLALGSDAVTAAHTFVNNCPTFGPPCSTVEQIVANDSTGTHILDSITTTGPYNPTPSMLNQLKLSGDTLTWSHAGSPRTAQLN